MLCNVMYSDDPPPRRRARRVARDDTTTCSVSTHAPPGGRRHALHSGPPVTNDMCRVCVCQPLFPPPLSLPLPGRRRRPRSSRARTRRARRAEISLVMACVTSGSGLSTTRTQPPSRREAGRRVATRRRRCSRRLPCRREKRPDPSVWHTLAASRDRRADASTRRRAQLATVTAVTCRV